MKIFNSANNECNKNQYENEGLALITADHINSTTKVKVTTYQCDICYFWHLTSVD